MARGGGTIGRQRNGVLGGDFVLGTNDSQQTGHKFHETYRDCETL